MFNRKSRKKERIKLEWGEFNEILYVKHEAMLYYK